MNNKKELMNYIDSHFSDKKTVLDYCKKLNNLGVEDEKTLFQFAIKRQNNKIVVLSEKEFEELYFKTSKFIDEYHLYFEDDRGFDDYLVEYLLKHNIVDTKEKAECLMCRYITLIVEHIEEPEEEFDMNDEIY